VRGSPPPLPPLRRLPRLPPARAVSFAAAPEELAAPLLRPARPLKPLRLKPPRLKPSRLKTARAAALVALLVREEEEVSPRVSPRVSPGRL